MSVLSEQCEALRLWAKHLREGEPILASDLREAADTILNLRDMAQQAQSEKAALERRIDELCAEVERLRERLKASDDGRMSDSVATPVRHNVAEDARSLIDDEVHRNCEYYVYLQLRSCIDAIDDDYERLKAENVKLREAVATAIKVQAVLCGDADRTYCRKKCPLHRQESDDCFACDVIGVAQELGIEANE